MASFTGDLSKWKTGSVTGLENLFHGAAAFNSNLATWDVAKATQFKYVTAIEMG